MTKRTNIGLLGIGTLVVLLLSGMNSFLSAQDASEDLELIRVVNVKNPLGVISPDGTKYAASNAEGVAIRDLETGEEICSVEAQASKSASTVFSPDGKRIAVVDAGDAATICDVETGRKITELKVDSEKRRQRAPDETTSISSFQFTPDGKMFLFEVHSDVEGKSRNNVTLVYHVESGNLVREWEVSDLRAAWGGVYGRLQSPDGRYLIFTVANSANPQYGIVSSYVVLDIEDGSVYHKFDKGVCPLWFTSDSKTLLCTKLDGHMIDGMVLFDMETKKEKKRLPYLGQPVAETPDGKHLFFFTPLAQASQDLIGIDIETGKTVYELKKLPGMPTSLNGRTLLVRSMEYRRAADAAGNEYDYKLYELTAPLDTLFARARSREEIDSATASSAPQWKQSRLITVDQMPKDFTERKVVCDTLALSPDGKMLVTSYYKDGMDNSGFHVILDSCYIVWDTTSGKEITRLSRGRFYSFACFLPNNKELVLMQSPDESPRKLSVFDTETWKIKRSFVYDGDPPGETERVISFNNGTCLCYKYENDAIITRKSWKVIDLTTGKIVFTSDGIVNNVFISQDGRMVGFFSYSIASESWKLAFYDTATRKKIREFKNPPFMDARFLPDGKNLLATYHDSLGSKHVVWDAESGEVLGAIGRQQYMQSPCVSPDGRHCYAINARTILIFDIDTYKQVSKFVVGDDDMYSAFGGTNQIVLSQDGKTLAVKSHWGHQTMIFVQK